MEIKTMRKDFEEINDIRWKINRIIRKYGLISITFKSNGGFEVKENIRRKE